MFDLIGLENTMTRHEAELLRKRRVSRKLTEELFTAPPPPGRPPAVRLKPSRCVQSVLSAAPLWPGWALAVVNVNRPLAVGGSDTGRLGTRLGFPRDPGSRL